MLLLYNAQYIANLVLKLIRWQKPTEIRASKIFLHHQRHLQTVNIAEVNQACMEN